VAVLIGLLWASTATAQTRSGRPTRSLFGSPARSGSLAQDLSLNLSFGGGLDDSIDDSSGTGPFQPAPSSVFASAGAGLSYTVDLPRAQFSANADTSLRYFTALAERPYIIGHGAQASGAFRLSSRTELSTGVGIFHQPRYFLPVVASVIDTRPGKAANMKLREALALEFGPSTFVEFVPQPGVLPGTNIPEHVDMQTGENASVGLSHSLTKRVGLYAGYGYQRTEDLAGVGRLASHSAAGGVTVRVGLGLAVRLGYGYSDAVYGPAGARTHFRRDSGTAGLDFNRSLSLTRRSSLSFGTGWAAVADPGAPVYHRLTGSARFEYELGRSWTASAAYHRDAGFVHTFVAPVLSDAASVGIGGQLSRRLSLNASAGVLGGQVGVQQNNNAFDSTFARAGLQLALSRHIAISSGYSYYRYSFEEAVVLPAGTPRRLNRQAFHVSLRLWAPIMQRLRRP
jgi:hypothetical protein